MRPFLEGETDVLYGPDEPVAIELGGTVNDSLFMGDWKIVRIGEEEWGNGEWQLYNMREDRSEMYDRSTDPEQHDRFVQMLAAYEEFLIDVNWVPARRPKK